MKCVCCDVLLTDFESTRKNLETEEYLDMCNKCLFESGLGEYITLEERWDLSEEEIGEEYEV